MDTEIVAEPLPLLGMCNLCLNGGAVKSMLLTYKINGKKELYTEMLAKCYSIDIAAMELGDTKKLICSVCVDKLRDAFTFRSQVDAALHTLQAAAQLHGVKKEAPADEVCDEGLAEVDGGEDFFSNELVPDLSLALDVKVETDDTEFAVKPPRKRRARPLRSKRRAKLIKFAKADAELADTEALLGSGLIPFKLRQSGTFHCAVCSENHKSLDDLKKHCTTHSKQLLHAGFRKMMLYNNQRFHKTSDKLRCKICTADISNYDELKSHLENCSRLPRKSENSKWNTLPFKLEKDQLDCPICKKWFINYMSLNMHMNVHYPNYICETCGKAFASKARLRGHIRTHEVGEFPCRYCEQVFDRVTKRENHVSKEHKSGIRYACRRCNISLTSFYARQKHLAEVHNEELKRYKCKACSQSYITPGHLSSHVRRDHLNERNHRCDKCDLAFYTKNSLNMHMIKHDGERIHSCPVCQKSYQRKKTLREHMRIHNNDKRFACPICGRAFTQKCTLKGHLKVHDRKLDLDDRVVPLHSD